MRSIPITIFSVSAKKNPSQVGQEPTKGDELRVAPRSASTTFIWPAHLNNHSNGWYFKFYCFCE
jgi:hypothetical protein